MRTPGRSAADYRPYLASQWHAEFDEWLAGVVNPWVDTSDTRNWNSDDRLAGMDAEGVTGEVLFPNTLPPFYDILAHLSGVPRDRDDFEHRWAGLQAHNRWLVDFCNEAPDRRRGLIQLLPNDIDVAVTEMRWAANTTSIGGVMLPAVAPNHPVEPYLPRPLRAAVGDRSRTRVPDSSASGLGEPRRRAPVRTSGGPSRTSTMSSGRASR